ncbi:hypothetical protein, partial [Xanthomonas euroxanthea]|uniref:hypothetical protein n=1 Tax=Xanthomonas euroxanthea TaxID=2259622 RepID=UPI001C85B407
TAKNTAQGRTLTSGSAGSTLRLSQAPVPGLAPGACAEARRASKAERKGLNVTAEPGPASAL